MKQILYIPEESISGIVLDRHHPDAQEHDWQVGQCYHLVIYAGIPEETIVPYQVVNITESHITLRQVPA